MIRAFIQNCKILILDEPTSSLDMMTDHFLFESLEILSQNTTILLIAHRESTLSRSYPQICFPSSQEVYHMMASFLERRKRA